MDRCRILCGRGRFIPNGPPKQSLSCLLSDRNPNVECLLRFECFYISERSNVVILPFSREENIVDIFFHTHTKKAKTQKRGSMHLLLYSDFTAVFHNRYFSS